MTSNLCDECSQIDFHAMFDETPSGMTNRDYMKGRNYRSHRQTTLANVAQEGECAFCKILLQLARAALSAGELVNPLNVQLDIGGRFWYPNEDHLLRTINPSGQGKLYGRLEIRLFLARADKEPAEPTNHATLEDINRSLSFDRLSLGTTDLKSKGERAIIRNQIPPSFNPTTLRRWLDSVSASGEESTFRAALRRSLESLIDQANFRVIDVSSGKVVQAQRNMQYVALSYVWGLPSSEQRTACNLILTEDRSTFDLWEELPRVICDSINLVKSIGQRYLWIDALCLDQSDAASLATSLPCMGSIYSCACLTIIAADGQDANTGLRRLRAVENSQEVPVILKTQNQEVTLLPSREGLDDCVENSKWISRAWTFQERLFAQNTVIFTSEEVFFRTRHFDAREAYEMVGGAPDEQTDAHLPLANRRAMPNLDLSDYFSHLAESYWTPINSYRIYVLQFCAREATYPGDRLDAFIGIAHLYEAGVAPTILYTLNGMHKAWFGVALGWKFRDPITARRVPQDHRNVRSFPSWSWVGWQADIDLPVHWGLARIGCEVKDDANIVCNLTDLPLPTDLELCHSNTPGQVILHLWAISVRCHVLLEESWDQCPIHVFIDSDGHESAIPLQHIFKNEWLDWQLADVRSGSNCALVALGPQMGIHPRFLIVEFDGELCDRIGHLEIKGNTHKAAVQGRVFKTDNDEKIAAVRRLQNISPEPKHIRMR